MVGPPNLRVADAEHDVAPLIIVIAPGAPFRGAAFVVAVPLGGVVHAPEHGLPVHRLYDWLYAVMVVVVVVLLSTMTELKVEMGGVG